jgi:hypothetical protein
MTREGHRTLIALSAAIWLAGCHSGQVASYPTFAPPVAVYTAVTGSSNAYDSYVRVAEQVESAATKHLKRVSFTAGQRAAAQKLLEPYVREIATATRHECQFEFTPRDPLKPPPYQRGWRLLGECLQWDVLAACTAGQFDRAVDDTLVATKFGFDLSGGGAVDASTGLHIADDVRRALAPYLDKLSATQLRHLEEGLKAALARKPAITQTLSNEGRNMMQAIQTLQESYRTNRLDDFLSAFGPDAREPINYLKELEPLDSKRAAFFSSLANYAQAVEKNSEELAKAPQVARAKMAGPSVAPDHNWKRLAKYIVGAPLPLLKINDLTTARTRLFVIESELWRRRKLHMALPADLTGFSETLAVDPYSGSSFIYRVNGMDYMVYSVGKDGLDNAGQTDSAFLQPDLKLERQNP